MEFRSNPDGSHFPLSKPVTVKGKPGQSLSSMSGKKSASPKIPPGKVGEFRLQAFLHEFAKHADPQGLWWLIGTMRSNLDQEAAITKIAKSEHFPRRLLLDLFRSQAWEYKPNAAVAEDPEIKQSAEELGKWLRERYPLYQPKKKQE